MDDINKRYAGTQKLQDKIRNTQRFVEMHGKRQIVANKLVFIITIPINLSSSKIGTELLPSA